MDQAFNRSIVDQGRADLPRLGSRRAASSLSRSVLEEVVAVDRGLARSRLRAIPCEDAFFSCPLMASPQFSSALSCPGAFAALPLFPGFASARAAPPAMNEMPNAAAATAISLPGLPTVSLLRRFLSLSERLSAKALGRKRSFFKRDGLIWPGPLRRTAALAVWNLKNGQSVGHDEQTPDTS